MTMDKEEFRQRMAAYNAPLPRLTMRELFHQLDHDLGHQSKRDPFHQFDPNTGMIEKIAPPQEYADMATKALGAVKKEDEVIIKRSEYEMLKRSHSGLIDLEARRDCSSDAFHDMESELGKVRAAIGDIAFDQIVSGKKPDVKLPRDLPGKNWLYGDRRR